MGLEGDDHLSFGTSSKTLATETLEPAEPAIERMARVDPLPSPATYGRASSAWVA